jgi:hypothetical protein
MQNGLGQSNPALVAFRQRIDALAEHALQACSVDRRCDAGALGYAFEAADLGDELEEALGGHVAVSRSALGQVAQARLGGLGIFNDVERAHTCGA